MPVRSECQRSECAVPDVPSRVAQEHLSREEGRRGFRLARCFFRSAAQPDAAVRCLQPFGALPLLINNGRVFTASSRMRDAD